MDKKKIGLIAGVFGALGLGLYLYNKEQSRVSTTSSSTTTQTQQTISLEINNISYSDGEVTVGVTNTGNVEWTFTIGLTLVANGISGSGCSLNASGNPYVNISPQSVTLSPGQQTQVIFNVSSALQQLSQYQTVYAIVKGYSDSGLQNCLTGSSIEISNPYYQPPSPPPSPSPIVSVTIDNAYSVFYAVNVTITNTGNTTWTFTVGATVVEGSVCGSGCTLNACGNPYVDLPAQSVTLAPGQSITLTFNTQSAMQSLGISVAWVIIKVWQDSSFTNCLAGTSVFVNTY